MTNNRQLSFHASDPSEVVEEMQKMADRANGKSWLNVRPAVNDEQAAVMADRTGVAGWFTGRGSDLPLATWVPADLSGRRPEPPFLGIQHGTGSNALDRFAANGLALPESWVKQQDSGKRGIVLAVPVRIPHREIIDYVTGAIGLLIPKFDFGMRFEAVIAES